MDQQHNIYEDSQETKKQRIPHDPNAPTTPEIPTTHSSILIITTTTEDAFTPTDPQLARNPYNTNFIPTATSAPNNRIHLK